LTQKHVLVFGASGFIAMYLVDELIANGYAVTVTDIADSSAAYYLKKGLSLIKVDITAQEQFQKLPSQQYEAVIHLAAHQPANVSGKNDPADYVRVNVIGTLNVLNFCVQNGVKKIIYCSSHRNTQGLWADKTFISEKDGRAIRFSGEYAMFSISESAAQDCVTYFEAEHRLPGIIFRLPPVYGYGPHTQIFKEGKRVKTGFQIFIDRAAAGQPLEIWGNPELGRDIVYVKDVVSALLSAVENDKVTGLFNIASGYLLTLREQVETIAKLFWRSDGPPVFRFCPERPNGIEQYVYDISKAEQELNWRPKYSFHEMLIDYRNEEQSGRYSYLVDKRNQMFNEAEE
jgi:UDP-glucose 4-epimerase